MFVFLLHATTGWAAPSEAALKAALLPHLISFSNWSTELAEPINICIDDEQIFAEAQGLAGKQINGLSLLVRRADNWQNCQLSWVNADHLTSMLLNEIQQQNTSLHSLVVSDAPHAAEKGAMVELKMNEEGKIRFALNSTQAKNQGITFNAKLQQLAQKIW
jgi:hypothetical protein